MEGLVAAGLTKQIGVSNFTVEQLEDLKAVATIQPFANQVEVHPYHTNDALRAYCAASGIRVMAYSPLGSSKKKFPSGSGCTLLENPVVKEVASELGKTPAQVLLKWSSEVDPNVVTIAKSSNATRISQNFEAAGDWELGEANVAKLRNLNANFRYFDSYIEGSQWHDGVIEG